MVGAWNVLPGEIESMAMLKKHLDGHMHKQTMDYVKAEYAV